ncbi:MAG TPA: sulfotransferase [Arenimonas sp.]|nr:sulfotransferase [Arenimonas sp.]
MTPDSNDIRRNWHLAETAFKAKDWRRAQGFYQQIISADDKHVPSLIRLASIHIQLDDFAAARGFSLRASELPIGDVPSTLMLARQLVIFSEKERLRHYLNAGHLETLADSQALAELSVLLNSAGDVHGAIRLVDRAIARDPAFAPAYYFRGNLKTFIGDDEGAQQDLNRCIGLKPSFAQAYWALSNHRTRDTAIDAPGRIRKQLALAKPGLKDEIYLSIALHNELHKAGDYDNAWIALAYGNAAKRKQVPYRHQATKALFDSLKRIDWQAMPDHARNAAAQPQAPIFIVGMHRSGTTLLEQMLAGHSDIVDGGESASLITQLKRAANTTRGLDAALIDRLAATDLGQVGGWYAANNAWRQDGNRYFTEKLPSNFQFIGFILKTIPGARVINLVRDPMSTCFSNLRNLFNFECGYSYDQAELGDYFGWYRGLMDFWHAEFPGAVCDVRYDDLVSDPAAAMQRVCAYLDIDYQPAMMALATKGKSVATASTVSVREGIQTDRNQQWMHYRAHLQPLIERLAPFK